MTEIEIIKELFKALSSQKEINIILSDGSNISGYVNHFDGEMISIGESEYNTNDIVEITDAVCIEEDNTTDATKNILDISQLIGQWVNVILKTDDKEELDGILLDVRGDSVLVVGKTYKRIILINDIADIKDSQTITAQEERTSSVNGFEKAVISANKQVVDDYLSKPERLVEEGYTFDEANRIIAASKTPVSWNDTERDLIYNQARRIYTYQGNRNGLAESLFNRYMEQSKTNYKLLSKSIGALIEIFEGCSNEKLEMLFSLYEKIIWENEILLMRIARAFLKLSNFNIVKKIVENNTADYDFEEILFELRYYENYTFSKVTEMLQLDVFSPSVSHKEINNLIRMPEKEAVIQLLNTYKKFGKVEEFFIILDIFMPYIKNDGRIIQHIGEVLRTDVGEKYIRKYLPEFVPLWFDKEITAKYLELETDNTKQTETIESLLEQCIWSEKYSNPNELEDALIKGNYALFETIRGNNSILLSLGYDGEIMSNIRSVEIQSLCDISAAERVYRLLKNDKRIFEYTVGLDFLRYPKQVCKVLFPILLEEGRARLLCSMFNYSTSIRKSLQELYPEYLKALLVLDKREEYYQLVRSDWMNPKLDNFMLNALSNIAEEKGECDFASLIRLWIEVGELNDVEKNIVVGNVAKLRSVAIDVNLLNELGYDADEIQLIQQNIYSRRDFILDDKISIANRVYSFQKNKHRVAEFYYKLGMEENEVLAALGLFSIYDIENRFAELCSVYEKYLSEKEELIAPENRERYLNALYYLGEYEKYYRYYISYVDSINVDSIILLHVFIKIGVSTERISELIDKIDNIPCNKIDILMDCVDICASSEKELFVGYAVELFNHIVKYGTRENVSEVLGVFSDKNIEHKSCSGVDLLFALTRGDKLFLSNWATKFMQDDSEPSEKINLIGRLEELIIARIEGAYDIIQNIIMSIREEGIEIPEKLWKYVRPQFCSYEEKVEWLNVHMQIPEECDEIEFLTCCELANEMNLKEELCEYMKGILRYNIAFADEYKKILMDLVKSSVKDGTDISCVKELLVCVECISARVLLSCEEMLFLVNAYVYVGNLGLAKLTAMSLLSGVLEKTLTVDIIEQLQKINLKDVSLYSCIVDEINNRSIESIIQMTDMWSQYLKITSEDNSGIEELRDYYNNPEKWSFDAKETLAKQICVSKNSALYWRLFRKSLLDGNEDSKIKAEFMIARIETRMMGPVLVRAANDGAKLLTIQIVAYLLQNANEALFENIYSQICLVVQRNKEWFTDKKAAVQIIKSLENNNQFSSTVFNEALDVTMMIALLSNAESELWILITKCIDNVDILIVKKFLCALVLNEDVQDELVKSVLTVISSSTQNFAYKEVLIELLEKDKLSDVQKQQIRIALANDSDVVDEKAIYQYYIQSIVTDERDGALLAIEEIKTYYPNLTVYEDIFKYEIANGSVTEEEFVTIYNAEYENMQRIFKPDRMLKTIVNMLPGEFYLKERGIETSSVFEYGLKTLRGDEIAILKQEYEIYESIKTAFSISESPELSQIIMKCCFLRQWRDLIEYDASNQFINDVIKQDHTLRRILMKRNYEILKGVALAVLALDDENEAVIERSCLLLTAGRIIRFNKNTIRKIQKLEKTEKEILKKVFTLRVESTMLRQQGIIGSALLSIPKNEKVAFVIGILGKGELSSIFNNTLSREMLYRLPKEAADSIAEVYAKLFDNSVDNIFSRYQAENSVGNEIISGKSNPFEDVKDECKIVRSKYRKKLSDVEKMGGDIGKQQIKSLIQAKAEYLYEAVIHDNVNDIYGIEPDKFDYVSVISMLFNRYTNTELREFVWKLDIEMLLPCLALELMLIEEYIQAYKIIEEVTDEWRAVLLQVQYRLMNLGILDLESQNLKKEIHRKIKVDNRYWIGKFMPVSLEQVPEYKKKMLSVYAFIPEMLEYLSFNGIEYKEVIKCCDDRLEKNIIMLMNKFQPKKSEIPQKNEVEQMESTETVSDYLSTEFIDMLLSINSQVEPDAQCLETQRNLKECVSAIKYFASTKHDSNVRKDIIKIKDIIRWTLIKYMDENGYSRERMVELLSLLSAEEKINRQECGAIISYLVKYFDEINSIKQLSRYLESDYAHIVSITDMIKKGLIYCRIEEQKIWENTAEVLYMLSETDFTRMSEVEQLNNLEVCRSKLLLNGEDKKTTSFKQISNRLLGIINFQITLLKSTPELMIDVLDEDTQNKQTILWEKQNNHGYLYAVISNVGGAECRNVVLISRINMTKVKEYQIGVIYPGEKIPFKESFSELDLTDDMKVTWDIELSYFDISSDKITKKVHNSEAAIKKEGEALELGNISTGNPAKGNNFVGRTRELALLKSRFSEIEQLPSMLIRGLKRSGKSSILIQMIERLREKDEFIVVMIDGQSVGENIQNAFVGKVMDAIRINYRQKDDYKDVIFNELDAFKNEWLPKMEEANWMGNLDVFYFELSQLFNKKLLVVIDEMEAIFYNHRFDSLKQEEQLYAALRALIQNTDNYVSFVFCGSDTLLTSCLEQRSESQMFQTLQYLEVGHMNKGDIQEIFRRQSEKYDINFSVDAVDAVWEYTNGLVWYAKLLCYLVINNILEKDLTIRNEVNRVDIINAVQMLINGEIGTDKYDLIDASLNTARSAIVHAMAEIMPDYNKEVSVDAISTSLKLMKVEGYTNPRNGETIPSMSDEVIMQHLSFLEKMQLIESNASNTKFLFTAELYRLFFRKEKKLHLFEERGLS